MSKRIDLDPRDFLVQEGAEIDLKRWRTLVKPVYKSKPHYEELLAAHVRELAAQQHLLYSNNSYSLLLILQGMDASGKDGVIGHVMSGVNPQGCQVYSFKHPSELELAHDFLWSAAGRLPERGRIGIFNRSYFEEVLIVRVHSRILRAERVPHEERKASRIWRDRFRSICALEKHLYRNGTRIIKVFLHLSKEEQRKRFLARIDEPAKNWKFSLADIEERKYWKQYMKAYEECLAATSTPHAPWYIVPADDKDNARLIVSQLIIDALKALKLEYPKIGAKRRKELLKIREQLTA